MLPDKPSIAVLAFKNLSNDVAQDYFVDGVVEDITTALAQFSQLFVSRSQLELHLQGPRRGRKASRPRAWGALCA